MGEELRNPALYTPEKFVVAAKRALKKYPDDMNIFQNRPKPLDPKTKVALATELHQFMSHFSQSMMLSVKSMEQELLEGKASIRQALDELKNQKGCLLRIKDFWSDGQPIFSLMDSILDTQYQIILNVDEWFTYIDKPSFNIKNPADKKKIINFVSRNRALIGQISGNFERVDKMYNKMTGLKFPEPDF